MAKCGTSLGSSDFVTLARLSDELGLGLGSSDAKLSKYIEYLDKAYPKHLAKLRGRGVKLPAP